jgi:hypothetical protein
MPGIYITYYSKNQTQYASLNIEMTGGTINEPVFNVVTRGRKRKSTAEDQTTAKKTKKAKLIFNF